MKKHILSDADYKRIHLTEELQKAQNALESAYSVFENVTEPDLIDYAIYQINAIQLQHKHILEALKQLNTTAAVSANETSNDVILSETSFIATDCYKYSELAVE